MRGEDQRESPQTQGIRYSSKVRGKVIEVKYPWQENENLYLPIQKHTNRVIVLNTFPSVPVIGDGVITSLKGVEIGVRTADCAPVVFVGNEWVGVIHAGWRGLASGILEKALERLSHYERIEELFVFIGPSAKSCCYEVGEELRNLFSPYVVERDGKLYMDLQSVAMMELRSMGVKNIGVLELCTVCSTHLPSYRRDKTSERLLTSVKIERDYP